MQLIQIDVNSIILSVGVGGWKIVLCYFAFFYILNKHVLLYIIHNYALPILYYRGLYTQTPEIRLYGQYKKFSRLILTLLAFCFESHLRSPSSLLLQWELKWPFREWESPRDGCPPVPSTKPDLLLLRWSLKFTKNRKGSKVRVT